MLASDLIDDGAFARLQHMLAEGDQQKEIDALLADPSFTWGLIARFGLVTLLSVPFWHAPALVHWGGQGPWQALFSSTLAVWRCKGALASESPALKSRRCRPLFPAQDSMSTPSAPGTAVR